MRLYLIPGVMIIISLYLAHPSFAINILIWDYDGFVTFNDPESYDHVGCQYGIEKALSANGYSYTSTYWLPRDLTPYDVIFIVLGFYCPG